MQCILDPLGPARPEAEHPGCLASNHWLTSERGRYSIHAGLGLVELCGAAILSLVAAGVFRGSSPEGFGLRAACYAEELVGLRTRLSNYRRDLERV